MIYDPYPYILELLHFVEQNRSVCYYLILYVNTFIRIFNLVSFSQIKLKYKIRSI